METVSQVQGPFPAEGWAPRDRTGDLGVQPLPVHFSVQQTCCGSWLAGNNSRGDERGTLLTSLHRRRGSRHGRTRWPEPSAPLLRRPWRPLESVTNNHPEVVNCFRGRRARGGKLFPRTPHSGALSAAAVVVTSAAATGAAVRRKQPRSSVGREGKAPQLGRRHFPRPRPRPGHPGPRRRAAEAPGARAVHGLGSFMVNSGSGARAGGRGLRRRPARRRQAERPGRRPHRALGRCLLPGRC